MSDNPQDASPPNSTGIAARIAPAVGVLLIVLGAIVALGWLLQSSLLVRISPAYPPMPLPVALCFMLTGAALCASGPEVGRWPIVCAAIAFLIGIAALIQFATGVELGFDRVLDAGWLDNPRPSTGRVSPASAVGMMLAAVALFILYRRVENYAALAAPLIAIAVSFIGLIALLAYLLKLELLFYWQPYARTATHSAFGLSLLGIGLWARWHANPYFGRFFQAREDRRLLLTAALALLGATLISTLVGFTVLERHTEQSFKRSLELSLQNNIEIYQDALKQGITATSAIATRPGIRRELGRLRTARGDRQALAFIDSALTSFLDLGFNAISMEDAHGREIVRVGHFVEDSPLRVPLSLYQGSELIWGAGLTMRIRRTLTDGRGLLGVLVTEQPLPLVNRLFENVAQLGQTAELSLCGVITQTIRCFPTRVRPYFFSMPFTLNGEALPMTHALQGFTGVALMALNEQGERTIAAYSTIPMTGLGIVISIDAVEMYLPIVKQLQYVMWLLGLLAVATIVALWLQTRPLSNVFLRARESARETQAQLREHSAMLNALLEHTHDAVYLKDREGRYVMMNTAGARRYGRTLSEVIGKTDATLWPQDVARTLGDSDRRVLESGETAHFEENVPLYDGMRCYRVTKAPYRDAHGEILGVVCVAEDVTDRRQAESVMRALSHTDELTGLHERESFATLAETELSVARRNVHALHLFLVQLQNAGDIQERYGREHAERARQDVAEVLRRTFRESDVLARLGENDFAALAPSPTGEVQEQVVARLQRHVEVHNRTARRLYELTIATAYVRYDPTVHANLDALLKDANDAMAHPLKHGRVVP